MTSEALPITLKPLKATAIAYVVFGILFIALGAFIAIGPITLTLSDGGPFDPSLLFGLPFGVPIAALGLVFAIRGPRMRVVLTDTDATIRNVFYTRVIPRKLVRNLGYKWTIYALSYPGIEWHDPSRKKKKTRVTVINFLSTAPVATSLQSRADDMTSILRRWCNPKEAAVVEQEIARLHGDKA